MPEAAQRDPDNLSAEKKQAREVAEATRASLFAELGESVGDAIAGHFLARWGELTDRTGSGHTVSGFWPFRDEINLRPLLHKAHERGATVCLPVVVARRQPLVFRRWTPETEMQVAAFGVEIPPDDAEVCRPDILLVPMLAFDRAGYRLGYGGGFYDRTLSELRASGEALALGVAFAGQEVARVPRGPDDERLDAIITDQGVFDIAGVSL